MLHFHLFSTPSLRLPGSPILARLGPQLLTCLLQTPTASCPGISSTKNRLAPVIELASQLQLRTTALHLQVPEPHQLWNPSLASDRNVFKMPGKSFNSFVTKPHSSPMPGLHFQFYPRQGTVRSVEENKFNHEWKQPCSTTTNATGTYAFTTCPPPTPGTAIVPGRAAASACPYKVDASSPVNAGFHLPAATNSKPIAVPNPKPRQTFVPRGSSHPIPYLDVVLPLHSFAGNPSGLNLGYISPTYPFSHQTTSRLPPRGRTNRDRLTQLDTARRPCHHLLPTLLQPTTCSPCRLLRLFHN